MSIMGNRSDVLTRRHLWARVLDCCNQDLRGTSQEGPQSVSCARHYKTWIINFTVRGKSLTRRYVAKVPLRDAAHDDWSPQREYEAFVTLCRIREGSRTWRVPEPVGFGVEPRFLVTRYVSGTPMRALAEPGMRLWAGEKDLATAETLCSRAGECLEAMRRGTAGLENNSDPVDDSLLKSCEARLDEIARFYRQFGVTRLCGTVRGQLNRIYVPALTKCKSLLAYRYGCHGDFSMQNMLVDSEGVITLLDLEGFHFSRVNGDAAAFRFRLEHLRLRLSFSKTRLIRCWQAFCRCSAVSESDRLYLTLSYLYKLLALLAWLPNPQRPRSESTRTRARNWFWARTRLAWLRQFGRAASFDEVWNLFWDDL